MLWQNLQTFNFLSTKTNINISAIKEGENFIIKYKPGEQAGLALHHDHSEFTCLTSLNEEYEGGGTWFYNQKTLIKNKIGEMVFHPGTITHLHGGRPVTAGVRYIIVSFCRCEGEDD